MELINSMTNEMQQLNGGKSGHEQLLRGLSGQSCAYCDGTLTREQFQSDEAVVCDECGTPAARIW
ncbi:HVO_A0556 family zinc finger protein [Natronoglomus mannanivorans]|uniref:HVO_A0556 family zinc finger protein n=1 Tax=Natronoglomus mannanivorans TaxID=2979990 RepID=UPI00308343C9